MQIICRKAFHFQQHEILDNLKTGEKVAIVKQEFRVQPNPNPQLVPDWLKDEDHFNMCVDDGSIQVVAVLSEPPSKGKKKAEDAKTMGWGASAAGLNVGR